MSSLQPPTATIAADSRSPANQSEPANRSGAWHKGWRLLWAILRQRCPRCHQGQMFRGQFAMNDPCPACGLLFQREEGYFLGAMYVSSALSMVAITPIYFGISYLVPNLDSILVSALALIAYLPLTPAVFRYSRVLWIYLDRSVCPSEVSAGSYEKVRIKHLSDHDDLAHPR